MIIELNSISFIMKDMLHKSEHEMQELSMGNMHLTISLNKMTKTA